MLRPRSRRRPPRVNCTPGSDWGTNRPDLAAQVLTLVNQHRAGLGLVQLTISICAADRGRRVEVAAHGQVQLPRPQRPAPPVARGAFTQDQRLRILGQRGGENIAYGYGTPKSVFTGWLSSPGP